MAADGPPITTIPPFSILPACAGQCGPLYDANGACVPPGHTTAAPSIYTQCFCSYDAISAFSTGSTGICGAGICTDPSDLSSIAGWFRSICGVGDNDNALGSTTVSSVSSSGVPGADNGATNPSSGGGSWFSTHWQWVVMLIILIIAIAGSWIGACIWRRRYLRRKDRQSAIGQKHSGSASRPSWGPAVTADRSALAQAAAMYGTDSSSARDRSSFVPGGAGGANTSSVFEDEKPRKKWLVGERT